MAIPFSVILFKAAVWSSPLSSAFTSSKRTDTIYSCISFTSSSLLFLNHCAAFLVIKSAAQTESLPILFSLPRMNEGPFQTPYECNTSHVTLVTWSRLDINDWMNSEQHATGKHCVDASGPIHQRCEDILEKCVRSAGKHYPSTNSAIDFPFLLLSNLFKNTWN